jgi:SecD/SecF fusion protein
MFGPATAGNIYSFGYTLLMGVIFNLIMGVGVARLLLRALSKFKFMRKPALFGGQRVGKPYKIWNVHFAANIKKYAVVSGALIAVIIVGLVAFGMQLDIQFRGGSIITYAYDGDVDSARFSDIVVENLAGASIQQSVDVATGSPTAVVSLPGNESVSADTLASLTDKLTAEFPAANVRSLEINNVSPTIGSEFLAKCLCALALAVILMLVYVAIRFRKIGGLSAGAMGVVALVHDCLIVFGVFVLFKIPLNMNFIAVILTIIGYSLNDTIVIYDRVRENKRLYGSKMSPRELVDLSVNQSLVRCINTSVTTTISMVVVTVVAMIFNVDSIFSFSFPLILGLISGTYSSVCLASPLWVRWQEHKMKQKNA